MSADSVNIGAEAVELYSPKCKIFLSESLNTDTRGSKSLAMSLWVLSPALHYPTTQPVGAVAWASQSETWVSKYCSHRLTIPSPLPIWNEFIITATAASQYHRRPWPVGLLSPSLIILSSVSLSIVARISQLDWVSHPGTVARCSQTYILSLSVPLPEAHFPVWVCRCRCQRLTFPCDESLGAVPRASLTQAWAGCHAAHQLCRSRLPRCRCAPPSCHPVVRRTWGDSRSPRVRLQQEDEGLCHIQNDLMGYYNVWDNQFVPTFQNNCCFYLVGDWDRFRWFQQPNLLLRWLLPIGSIEQKYLTFSPQV